MLQSWTGLGHVPNQHRVTIANSKAVGIVVVVSGVIISVICLIYFRWENLSVLYTETGGVGVLLQLMFSVIHTGPPKHTET